MDIVNFWKLQTDKWQADNKCGLCWQFGAPLVQSQINISQSEADKACCVNVFVTDITYNEVIGYNSQTGFRNVEAHEWSFNIHVLTPVQLGVNNYNEIKGHDIDESKWVTVFKPILDCLSTEKVLDFCFLLNERVNITKWQGFLVHNYLDSNLNGWRFAGTFRINK